MQPKQLPYVTSPFSQMPRTLGDLFRTAEIRLDDGTILGSRNGLDAEGRLRPLHPRPWHSYRGARRRIMRPSFQQLCKRRRIDAVERQNHLAYVEARQRIREALIAEARRLEDIQVAELTRLKLAAA